MASASLLVTMPKGGRAEIRLPCSQVKFDVVLAKDGVNLGPLTLKGFKATVSNTDVEKRFRGFDQCELDPTGCELGLE
eukprot:7588128-Pyramimonas_sp.AAC.1